MKSEDAATFELEMELKDPNSRIFLYKVTTSRELLFETGVTDGID